MYTNIVAFELQHLRGYYDVAAVARQAVLPSVSGNRNAFRFEKKARLSYCIGSFEGSLSARALCTPQGTLFF